MSTYEFQFTPALMRREASNSLVDVLVDVCTLSMDETHKNPYKPD